MGGAGHRIRDLIAEGEHLRLDFKFAVNDAKKIARSLSAFANTEGGTLLIGVKDNGGIAGVRSEEEYHMVEAASQMYTKPEVRFTAQKHFIDGKTVLEIIVLASDLRPHLAPDIKGRMRAFVRVADENKMAHGVHYQAMLARQKEIPAQINYSDAERFLLDYLDEKETITFTKFYKYAGISPARASSILVGMMTLEVIEICYKVHPPVFCTTKGKIV